MRRAARVDANHGEIVRAFNALGIRVLDLSAVGSGCPDLLILCRNRLALVEIKDGSKTRARQALTPQQMAFRAQWTDAPLFIARSVDDVGEIARILVAT